MTAKVKIIMIGLLMTMFGVSAMAQSTTGTANGHGWVDLGLPSGTKWATCNIGSTRPEQVGKYYSWGETTTKATYTEENCKTWRKRLPVKDIAGDPAYDAATANWGSEWCLPSKEQYDELFSCCDSEFVQINGVWGRKFKSPTNNNWLFLPCNGVKSSSGYEVTKKNAMYWTSTTKNPMQSYHFLFGLETGYTGWSSRISGYNIRAVYKEKVKVAKVPSSGVINGHEYVDLGLPSGKKWATCNVGAQSAELHGEVYVWGEVKQKKTVYSNNLDGKKGVKDWSGDAKYDVARSQWGGSWRVPTHDEMEELVNNCTWEWTSLQGRNGYKVMSKKNGNYIFLPVVSDYNDAGKSAKYWTSTPQDMRDYSYYYSSELDLYKDWYKVEKTGQRNKAQCIRAISD